jgi:hypothetical protein
MKRWNKLSDRWVIYEYPSLDADDGDEVSWHKTELKAQEVANANHAKTGLPYRIDLCWGSGGVAQWECEGSEADVYGVGFDAAAFQASAI